MIDRLLIGMIRVYQLLLAPIIGPCCRFTPSCSTYCIDAIRWHGPWRGIGMGLRRLTRCRPFGPLGHDPVPKHFHKRSTDLPMSPSARRLPRGTLCDFHEPPDVRCVGAGPNETML